VTPVNVEAIPEELRARPQWVCWKLELREGKLTKVPYNPRTGGKARSDLAKTWGTLKQALARAERDATFHGIGYVFARDDPYVGVDLDNCIDDDRTLKPWALPLFADLDGYTEVTPSGKGLHIIVQGSLPAESRHKVPQGDGHVEVYDWGRFFTMTGRVWGVPVVEVPGRVEQVAELARTILGPKEPEREPVRPAQPVNLDDRALLELMEGSRNGFQIHALMSGDTSGHGGDDSSADLALCNHLAWWTDRDPERMDRLFRQSGLYREKWERSDYRDMTIKKAIAGTADGFRPGVREEPPPLPTDADAPPAREFAADVHEATRRENEARRKLETLKNGAHAPPPPEGVFTAEWLMGVELPEPRWAVPGILAEGANMLAGRPKLGKSFLAFNLAIAVASGGKALGSIQVEKGEVLYLALEDTKRRLKRRMKMMLRGEPVPQGLYLVTSWPHMGADGGEQALEAWIRDHPDLRLVIIDTLGYLRGTRDPKAQLYDEDVETIRKLKSIADRHSICILIIHHVRKSTSDDPLEMVSGTHGLTGTLDTVTVLARDRCDLDGSLFVTGRDVDEERYALRFDANLGTWALVGTEEERLKSRERESVLRVLMHTPEPMTPAQVAKVLEKNRNTVKQLMWTMASEGEILSVGEGKYCRRQAN